MSATLMKTTARKNAPLLGIFIGVLAMYLMIMVAMYDPDDIAKLTDVLKLMPDDLVRAMGFSNAVSDLTGYLASWLYGIVMFGFPMVYCIILSNRLVAKMVDDGSFAYLLSTPNSRVRIILTQGGYALLSVAVLFAAMYILGLAVCGMAFPGLLNAAAFLRLNVTTMLVNMVVMMLGFFFSCLCNSARRAVGFGAGVPIAFLLMYMLGGAAQGAQALKRASIFGFYDPVALVGGAGTLGVNLLYAALIIVLFAAGAAIFHRKRLPL